MALNIRFCLCLLGIILPAFAAGCFLPSDAIPSVEVIEPDEDYEVYSALFEGDGRLKGLSEILIVRQTNGGTGLPVSTFEDLVAQLGRQPSRIITPELVDDYRNKNQTPSVLIDKFEIRARYELVDAAFLGSRKDYAPSSVSLSKVAFDREKSRAVLYVSWYGGPKSAFGGFRTFEKKAGKWVLIEKLDLWVS